MPNEINLLATDGATQRQRSVARKLPTTPAEFASYINDLAQRESIPAIIIVNHDPIAGPPRTTPTLPAEFLNFFRTSPDEAIKSAGDYYIGLNPVDNTDQFAAPAQGLAIYKLEIRHKTDMGKHKNFLLTVADGYRFSNVRWLGEFINRIGKETGNSKYFPLFHHAHNVDARENIIPVISMLMKMNNDHASVTSDYINRFHEYNSELRVSAEEIKTLTLFLDKLLAEGGDKNSYTRFKNITEHHNSFDWRTLGESSPDGYVKITGAGRFGSSELYVDPEKKFMIIKEDISSMSLRVVSHTGETKTASHHDIARLFHAEKTRLQGQHAAVADTDTAGPSGHSSMTAALPQQPPGEATTAAPNSGRLHAIVEKLHQRQAGERTAAGDLNAARPSVIVENPHPRQAGESSAVTVPDDVSRKRAGAADAGTSDASLPKRLMAGKADASASTSAATGTRETDYPQQLIIQLGTDDADGRVTDARMNLAAKHRGDEPRPLMKTWANLDTPPRPIGALQAGHGALRVTLLGHGRGLNADNQPTMGGFTAEQVAQGLYRAVPVTLPIKTLSLVGCDLKDFAKQLATLTLRSGEGGRPARVETLHARDGVMMVAGVSFGDLRQHGRKGSAKLIKQESDTSTSVNTPQVVWHNYKYVYRHDDATGGIREGTINRAEQAWMRGITTAAGQRWLGEVVELPARASGAAGPVPATRAMLVSGTGLRLYGMYRSLTSLGSALQAGNDREAAIGAGAIATDILSEVAERKLMTLGQQLLIRRAASGPVANMGIGRVFARGAPALNLLTVPFDVYDAYVQFELASRAEGQARVDALVYGGLATAQASLAVATTVAAITLPIIASGTGAVAAGAAAATSALGPAGLAAAGVLLAAERGYTAVRIVQEVERWMPLSGLQKVQVAAHAMLTNSAGSGIDAEVMAQQLAAGVVDRYRQWLESPDGQVYSEVIMPQPTVAWRVHAKGRVNNPAPLVLASDHLHQHVHLQDKVSIEDMRTGLCRAALSNTASDPAAHCPGSGTIEHIERLEFYIKDTDDFIDATSATDPQQLNRRSSQPILRISVAERPEAAVYFDVGHGDDNVNGARNRPNRFLLGSGSKTVHGGEHNDEIVLSARPDFRQPPMLSGDLAWQTQGEQLNRYQYHVDGGAGEADSLFLNTDLRDTPYRGYRVDLEQHSIAIINTTDPTENPARPFVHKLGVIHRIEHIGQGLDLPWDSYHHFLGDAGTNRLLGRSHDQLEGRAGDDILILADQAKGSGGEGIDTYQVWLRKDTDCVQIADAGLSQAGVPEFSRVLLHHLQLNQLASWRIEQGHLILRADHGGQLQIMNLYRQQRDGSWRLDNPHFSVHTADGFSLVPVLPETLAQHQIDDKLEFAVSWLAAADAQITATADTGLSINLGTGQVSHNGQAVHTLAKPYRLYEAKGGAGNDEITGSPADEKLYSSGGRDILRGGGGYDSYIIAEPTGEVTIETAVVADGSGAFSTVSLPHARLDQLNLRVEDQDLLLAVRTDNVREGAEGALLQTLRLKHGLHPAHELLSVRDREGGMLGWRPGSLASSGLQLIQVAGQGDSWLASSGVAKSNILIGREGRNTLSALQGNTLLQGGEGADNYRLLGQASVEAPAEYWIDNRAEDGQEDRVVWRTGRLVDGWEQLSAHKMGAHLVLSDGAPNGDSTTTRLYLTDYYQADTKSRHISLSLITGTSDALLVDTAQLEALAERASQAAEASLPGLPTMAQLHQIIAAMSQFDADGHADGLALSMPERAHTLPVLAAA